MRLNDERAQRARLDAQEAFIRAVVREEILTALRALRTEVEHYDGGEIKDMAADMLSSVLDCALGSLAWPGAGALRDTTSPPCGVRRPAPAVTAEPPAPNPFEEKTDG